MTEVTEKQVSNIKHSLGFRNDKAPKQLYRNHWCGENEENNKSSILGYMHRWEILICSNSKIVMYRVLPKGLDLIFGYGYSLKNKKKLIKNEILFKKDYEVQNA